HAARFPESTSHPASVEPSKSTTASDGGAYGLSDGAGVTAGGWGRSMECRGQEPRSWVGARAVRAVTAARAKIMRGSRAIRLPVNLRRNKGPRHCARPCARGRLIRLLLHRVHHPSLHSG